MVKGKPSLNLKKWFLMKKKNWHQKIYNHCIRIRLQRKFVCVNLNDNFPRLQIGDNSQFFSLMIWIKKTDEKRETIQSALSF